MEGHGGGVPRSTARSPGVSQHTFGSSGPGHDVDTVLDEGLGGQSDAAIWEAVQSGEAKLRSELWLD